MHEAYIRGSYDPGLVCLSILVATCASFAALELAGCTSRYRGTMRWLWIAGGAVAMGIGIWAMHYIGMLALKLPVTVLYDMPVVALSLLAAIASAAVALLVVSHDELSLKRLLTGSVAMGFGIFGMHYIGMSAMRLPAHCSYNIWIVAASGAIAIAVSGAALWITYSFRDDFGSFKIRRFASAGLMGLAVAAMHYTGMAAVCFRPSVMVKTTVQDLSVSGVAVQAIVIISLVILGLTVAAVVATRHVSRQTDLLKSTQAEYRLFLEHNLAGLCRTSLDGRVLDANQTVLTILGYQERADILGIDISKHYWSPEDRAKVISELRKRGIVRGAEIRLKRLDGTPVWIIFTILLRRNVETRVLEILASITDISGLKKTQEALLAAKEAAEAADRAKSRFLANMSHELRTPLNGVLGMTTLALDSDLPCEARECLEVATTSARALLRIIDDVLDYSMLDSRQLKLKADWFSLPELMGEAIQSFSGLAAAKKIDLTLELAEGLPGIVAGDRMRLRQMLSNLLDNAVKFTFRGGVLMKVEGESAGSREMALIVTICDTGLGIPEEKLNTICQAFTQADESNTRRFGGTGLGLAICSRLAAAMKGSIRAESRLNEGSTFHLRVILGVESEPADSRALEVPEQSPA